MRMLYVTYIYQTLTYLCAMYMASRFVSIMLPVGLAEMIDEMIGKHGYRSRADFVSEAVRLRIEYLKRKKLRRLRTRS